MGDRVPESRNSHASSSHEVFHAACNAPCSARVLHSARVCQDGWEGALWRAGVALHFWSMNARTWAFLGRVGCSR